MVSTPLYEVWRGTVNNILGKLDPVRDLFSLKQRGGEDMMKYALQTSSDSIDVTMEGTFTFLDSRAFAHLLGVIKSVQTKEIRFNINALSSMDATALGLMMRAFDAAKRAHRAFVLVSPVGQVREALLLAASCNALTIMA
jgi:anti-anti-sigma regulatory factor